MPYHPSGGGLARQWGPYVREAATIGLLEDLQNTGVVGEDVPAKVIRFLGPESTRWWNKVLAFWEHGTAIRDD